MRWCMIELTIRCPHCEAPVHLEGPRREVFCGKCMSSTKFPPDVWSDTLKDAISGSRKLKTGQGTQSTIFGHFNMSLLYGNLVPYCPACKKDFDSTADRSGETLKCSDCDGTIPYRDAPQWLRELIPVVKLIAGAPGEQDGESGSMEKTGKAAIALTCPKCSAALFIDGSNRLVPCGYCGTGVYLPDDLWLRLHPAKKKSRWFIGF